MNSSDQKYHSQMGFTGWLGILFVALKLTGYIDWPWLWVLSPLWIPIVILLVIALVAAIVYLILKVINK